VDHLTRRWARLSTTAAPLSVYVATFLVSRRSNWTSDDYLGSAVAGFPEGALLTADATRGDPASLRLRYLAPDLATATQWAQDAMTEVARMANAVDSLRVRPGRRGTYEKDASVVSAKEDWRVVIDLKGQRTYVHPNGAVITGDGYGRMKWTVIYSGGTTESGDYGMTDTLAEAMAWGEQS